MRLVVEGEREIAKFGKEKYWTISAFLTRGPVGLHPRPTSSLASLDSGARRGSPAPATRSDGCFLIVSRLVSYKRIDIAVKAFNNLQLPLKIIGTGSDMQSLKNMARQNIEFLGNLTDNELVRYYIGCQALVFPGLEDFGLTILEAQNFGKPVIAFRAGGALETIIEGKTGLFFDKQNVGSLTSAVNQFNNLTINSNDCIENARKFSFDRFKNEILKQVEDTRRSIQDDNG